MDVVTRLDEYGNVNADLTEITAVMVGGKVPPAHTGPLTEAVKKVAIHQADGYSPLTPHSIPYPAPPAQPRLSRPSAHTTRFSLNSDNAERVAALVSFGNKGAIAWMTVKETKQHVTNLYSVEAIKLEAFSRKIEEELAFAPLALNASTPHSILNSAVGNQGDVTQFSLRDAKSVSIGELLAAKDRTRFSMRTPKDIRRAINRSNLTEDAKAQMHSILKAYTNRDGTFKRGFLKAPNGNLSKLGAWQWLQVRTENFRNNYFGDWLNLLRGNMLKSAGAIKVAKSGTQFSKPSKSAIEDAVKWIEGVGPQTFNTEVGDLLFDRKSVKGSLEHAPFTQSKFDAVFSIPEGFKNAVYLGTFDDFDGNTITNHYFAYPVEYDGKRQIVFCRARENADRAGLYVHDIFVEQDITNEAPVLPPDITALKAEIAQGVYRGSELMRSILKVVYGVKRADVSKVTDENGEPIGVYHGSMSDFTVFDTDTAKRGNIGSYFSPWKEDATGYGDNLIACFLSIKNPAPENEAFAALRKAKNDGRKAMTELQQLGHDGVDFGGLEYSVFSPTQIKSATDNTGAFDPANPDIRFSFVTPAEDAAYVRYAQSDDRRSANPLKNDAAVRAGYAIEAYHGTPDRRVFEKTFVFSKERLGENTRATSARKAFFFARGIGTAASYSSKFDNLGTMMAMGETAKTAREWVKVLSSWMSRFNGDIVPQYVFDRVGRTISTLQSDRFTEETKAKSVCALGAWFDEHAEIITGEMYGSSADEDEIAKSADLIFAGSNIATDMESIRNDANGRIYPVRLKMLNPLVHDFSGREYRDVSFSDLIDEAVKNGNDGLVLENVKDGAGHDTVYCVFEPSQIKSNRVFEYDDAGNLIPLSERFNQNNPDIRFSVRVNAHLRDDVEAMCLGRRSDGEKVARRERLTFSSMPDLLVRLGLPDVNIESDRARVMKIVSKHGLTYDQVADLPNRYSQPVAVFGDGDCAYVVLTDMMAKTNAGAMKPVMVRLTEKVGVNGESVFVASAYPREADKESEYVRLANTPGSALYFDENKVAALGLEEGTMSTLCTLTSRDDVMTPEEYSSLVTAHSIPYSPAAAQGGRTAFSIAPVYTGSAADYDKPSLVHVGSGEGSQVYGWGLYGSGVRGVAEGYAKRDAFTEKAHAAKNGKRIPRYNAYNGLESLKPEQVVGEAIVAASGDKAKAKELVDEFLRRNEKNYKELSSPYNRSIADIAKAAVDEFRTNGDKYEYTPEKKHKATQGNIYSQTFFTNRAPGDESHLLSWYEPVSKENINRVEQELEKEELPASGVYALIREWEHRSEYENLSKEEKDEIPKDDVPRIVTGEMLYKALCPATHRFVRYDWNPKAASEFLARADIDGIKYPVDSYGGKGVKDGDNAGWNYVSFRDDNIRIDHKWVDGQTRFSIAPADYKPEKTYHDLTGKYLYKTMRLVDGHLEYPMAGTGVEVPTGVWLKADDNSRVNPKTGKRETKLRFGSKDIGRNGRPKSNAGTAAPFAGFHMGSIPYMAHIGLGGTPAQKHFQNADYVWVAVDVPMDRTEEYRERTSDYANEDAMRGVIPDNGMYYRKTNPNMKGKWGVAGQMKIVKVLSDDDVDAILDMEAPDRVRMGRQGGGKFNAASMRMEGQDLANWNLLTAEEEFAMSVNIDKLLAHFDEAKGMTKEDIFKTYSHDQVVVATLPDGMRLPSSLKVANPIVKSSENYILDHVHNHRHELTYTREDVRRLLRSIAPKNEMRVVVQRGSCSLAFISQNPKGGWDCVVIAPRRGEFYIFKTMFGQKRKPYQGFPKVRFSLGSGVRNEAVGSLLRGPLASFRDADQSPHIIPYPAPPAQPRLSRPSARTTRFSLNSDNAERVAALVGAVGILRGETLTDRNLRLESIEIGAKPKCISKPMAGRVLSARKNGIMSVNAIGRKT